MYILLSSTILQYCSIYEIIRHIPVSYRCGEAGQRKTHYLSVNREYYSLFSLFMLHVLQNLPLRINNKGCQNILKSCDNFGQEMLEDTIVIVWNGFLISHPTSDGKWTYMCIYRPGLPSTDLQL